MSNQSSENTAGSGGTSDHAKHFAKLLGRHRVIDRINILKIDEDELPSLSATFLYPKFRQNKVLIDELCKLLVGRITGFCSTKKEIKEAKLKDQEYEYETGATDALNDRARRLFIKARKCISRSGEGGELLLFVLIEEILKAPLIVSKMRLKTNTQMPVYGSDGIHARWDDQKNTLVLYLGESKLHKTLSSAVTDALESILGIVQNIEERHDNEIEVAYAHKDFGEIPPALEEKLIKFLNPWEEEESTRRLERFAVLLGFDAAAYNEITKVSPSETEKIFAEIYKKNVKKTLQFIERKFKEADMHLENIDLFIFPVPSVDIFRKNFQERLYG